MNIGNNVPESDFNNTIVKEHFATPGACYDALMKRYGDGEKSPAATPRYLFRGESRYYPSSTPGTYRALCAHSHTGVKFARIDATGMFVEDYEAHGGDSDEGECLAQHYLSTSDCLDFSASLGVALAFALDEEKIYKPRSAYIAVLDYERAALAPRFSLYDLRGMRNALRPIRQNGFVAVHHAGNFVDLKEAECCRKLGLLWFSFTVAPDDIILNRHPEAPSLQILYDIQGDVWAEKMIQHLNCLIDSHCSQWGEDGLNHLIQARTTLLSRNRNSGEATC